MSCYLNPVTCSTELVDVLRNSDQVHDLSRDVAKGLWNETSLVVQTVGKTPEVVEYTAFTTAITLSNAQSYPVNIFSKDSPIALVQNRTHRLGNKAEEFLTDSSGCVAVVIPVSNNAISCSKLGVWLKSPINSTHLSRATPVCNERPIWLRSRVLSDTRRSRW